DLPPLSQKLGGFARDAGEMQIGRVAGRVRAQISLPVQPELSPPRPDERDRIVGYLPVSLLPRSDVVDGQKIIGVLRGGLGNIDHDGWRYEARNRNLVGGQLALAEMNRRVQVRAPVFARGVSGRRVPVTARGPPPRLLLPLKGLRRRPIDGLLVEAVGQVDDLRFVNPDLLISRRRT